MSPPSSTVVPMYAQLGGELQRTEALKKGEQRHSVGEDIATTIRLTNDEPHCNLCYRKVPVSCHSCICLFQVLGKSDGCRVTHRALTTRKQCYQSQLPHSHQIVP